MLEMNKEKFPFRTPLGDVASWVQCPLQVRFGKAALAGSIARNLQSDLIQLGQARPEEAMWPTMRCAVRKGMPISL